VLDLFRRQLEHIVAERNALRLKCNSSDDKLALLRKQLEASEGHRAEYLRRYEEIINDKQKISRTTLFVLLNFRPRVASWKSGA